jgi:amino acid transporter
MWAWSLLYVAAVFLIQYLGVQLSTRVQLTLALVSAVVVLAFFAKVILDAPENSLRAFDPGESADGWSGILFGVLYGVLIFVGFETAANLAEETAEPKRAIPRAVLLTVVVVALFYVIAAYAMIAGFGFDIGVLTSPDVAAAPLFALGSPPDVGGYGSNTILKVLEVVVLLDVMAVGLGAAVASARGVFALARDRRIPGMLATVSPTRGTPVGAIVFVELVSVVMVLFAELWDDLFAIAETPHYLAMFQWLSTFGGFALMIVYALMALGSIRGLADHPKRVAVMIAALVGLSVAIGAVFGGVYRQKNPFDRVWVYVAVWTILGAIVTLVVSGRAPAREVLRDLHSGGEPAPGMP